MMNANVRNELIDDELEFVNGGNWVTDVWDKTCKFVSEHKNEIIAVTSMVVGGALCATGAGAVVGAGLIGGTITVMEGAVAGAAIGGSAAGMTAAAITSR